MQMLTKSDVSDFHISMEVSPGTAQGHEWDYKVTPSLFLGIICGSYSNINCKILQVIYYYWNSDGWNDDGNLIFMKLLLG